MDEDAIRTRRSSPYDYGGECKHVVAVLLAVEDRDADGSDAGGETGRTVHDHKREIDRLFEDAAGRRGVIEYDTRVDVSQYHDLAETHRERGRVEAATDVYRAIVETIRENLNRVDDSSGYYGDELERAVESYAETVAEADLDHEEKRPHVEYLFGEFVEADYRFASEDYEDALRTICTTREDLEH